MPSDIGDPEHTTMVVEDKLLLRLDLANSIVTHPQMSLLQSPSVSKLFSAKFENCWQ